MPLHRLEVPWRRAQIHEYAMGLFARRQGLWRKLRQGNYNEEAIAKQIFGKFGGGLEERHEHAIREEVSNLVHAANTSKKINDLLKRISTSDFIYALTGRQVSKARTVRGLPFAVHFVVGGNSMMKLQGEELGGISGVNFIPVERKNGRRAELQETIKKALGIENLAHVASLCNLIHEDNVSGTVEHEARHTVSTILEGHLKPGTAALSRFSAGGMHNNHAFHEASRNEEIMARWGLETPEEIANTMTDRDGDYWWRFLPEKAMSLLSFGETTEPRLSKEEKEHDILQAEAYGISRHTQDGKQKTWSQVKKESLRLGKALLEEERENLLYKLKELERLQKQHRLKNQFMVSLLRTNSLDHAIRVINYNTRKQK